MPPGGKKGAGPTGAEAEDLACAWLQARGLRLRERNYRCRRGEIDLIMQDGEQLVFVEVRYRANDRWGGGLASVTRAKQQRLARTARLWLKLNPDVAGLPCRFDVVSVTGPQRAPKLKWVRGAFAAQ